MLTAVIENIVNAVKNCPVSDRFVYVFAIYLISAAISQGCCSLAGGCLKFRKKEEALRCWTVSNRRPSACEADVMTCPAQEHAVTKVVELLLESAIISRPGILLFPLFFELFRSLQDRV
uniref:Secreted protein n=1 Tax=Syphacia muris TaxID=451379 RepID=A0A0N5ABM7_9BILA